MPDNMLGDALAPARERSQQIYKILETENL